MRIGFGTSVGRVRPTNEDALWCDTRTFVVADGMGGAAAGEVAAHTAVETVRTWRFPPVGAPLGTVTREAKRAIEAANLRIYEKALRSPALRGMGTTLTMALVARQSAVIAHVGDSRAYVVAPGRVRQITHDHSVVAELVRHGTISPDEAQDHPHRHLLTRALGTSRFIEVDLYTVRLEPGEGLLLCTDGLTGVVEDEEIARAMVTNLSPQAIVDHLLDLVDQRGAPDNVSAVLIFPQGQGAPHDG